MVKVPRKTNFEVNGQNYYRVTATAGKKPDGSPIRKQFYGTSKKEAETKRDEYMANIKKGLAVNYDKALFGVAFQSWFEDVLRPSVTLSTYKRYEIDYRLRIADSELKSMRLTDIRAANVQAYYNSLLYRCSPKTVRAVHKLLSRFFGYCVKADIVLKNPLLAVDLPKVETLAEINKALPDSDIDKLLQVAQGNIRHFIYTFAMFSGLREGEILALTHKDIDFDEGVIRVNKSVKYLTVDGVYRPVVNVPKTSNSIRTVPILDAIRGLLKEYMRYEKEKHLKCGVPFSQKSVLFSSDTCTYREAPNLLRSLKRLCKRIDIEPTTFHSLRHTFCTILAKQGVPLKTASMLMGHSDISITARIYTHVDDAEMKKGIEKLSAYFN